ncbi:trans-aconitate 2-methyltransferase [Microbulbifer sp. NBRC 101763]|uniref:class I SAM-dependent methyltransferase n=1 Tax=unclassified Microbulbifer TaxID=2619833 RepID=UPI0024ACED4C|nr:class I SAM-dependent methyltransferase [Microbulbifer sp. MLAF003]WHI50352.1 class I SAM-dependent methyltransferase [Microbulbifer sp. MLAF003]
MDKPIRHDKWQAQEYVKASSMQWRHAMEAIQRCNYQKASAILDVGCGDGRITHYLAERLENGKIIGVDLTEDMIHHARKVHTGIPNLSFEQMSADEIQFNEQFDIIFSFSCLHWVADQKKVWDGFYKHLKEGGKIVVGFQVGHENFWDTVYEFQHDNDWQPYFESFLDPYNHYTLNEMRNYIEGSGFYLPRIDEIHHVENFGTRDTLTAFFLSWVPQFRHLQPPQREKFSHQVMSKYFKKIEPKTRKNAGIRIKRFIIEAEK